MIIDDPLFAGFDPPPAPRDVPPVEKLSADRRRTKRQADDIALGRHPLTGGVLHPLASRHRDAQAPKDDPFTCGSCWFRELMRAGNKRFAKCTFGATVDRPPPRVTSSVASDVRAWWPACPEYSPSDRIGPDAARSIPTPTRNEA